MDVGSDNFTVLFRINFTDWPLNSNARIIQKQEAGGLAGNGYFMFSAANGLALQLRTTVTGTFSPVNVRQFLSLGSWRNLAYTVERDNVGNIATETSFSNGGNELSQSGSLTGSLDNNGKLYFPRNNWVNTVAWLDEFRLYHGLLSSSYIAADYLNWAETLLYYGDENPPPTVTTQVATSVTASTFVVNGNLTSLGGVPASEVWFQYGTTPSLGSSTTPVERNSTGAFNATLTSPSSDVAMYFRSAAENIDGTTYGTLLSVGIPSATGSFMIKTLLRIVLALAILAGVVTVGLRGTGVFFILFALLGVIAFVVIDAFIISLF